MLIYKTVHVGFRLQIYFTLALTASLPTHHLSLPASTDSLSAQSNLSIPANLSLVHPSFNSLPTDPTAITVRDTSLLLFFHDYGPPLPRQDAYATLGSAVGDVQRHIFADPDAGNIPMPPRPGGYLYGSRYVRLLFEPAVEVDEEEEEGEEEGVWMTWGMWGNTLTGVRLFGEEWEFVALKFVVWDAGDLMTTREVGRGRLWWTGSPG